MPRESTAYDAAAERFLTVESAVESEAVSAAPVDGIVYDAELVSPAALPTAVRRRLAEQLSTHRLQDAADAASGETMSDDRLHRTELSAFPRPVVPTTDDAAAWADDLRSLLPEQLVALTVVDPEADIGFLPEDAEREALAEAFGHQAVTTAFVFPDHSAVPDQLGLPTLSGLFDIVADADSLAELNQRRVPLKPLDTDTAFVHTHENRTLPDVPFSVERAAFEAGNVEISDGECRIDPDLKTRLQQTQQTRRTQNELVFGGLLAAVGALPVVNIIIQSMVTASGVVSSLLFGGAAICMILALTQMGSTQRELKSLAATPS